MIDRSTNIKSALRSRQRGFLLNPFRFSPSGGGGGSDPLWSSVALLLPLDAGFTDASSSPKTVTNSLGTIVSSPSKFGSGALSLPGSGSRITTSSYALGAGSFCIEFWLYLSSLPNAQKGLFGNSSSSPYVFAGINGSNQIFVSFNGAPTIGGDAEFGVTAGVWNHIAIVRNMSACALYINGSVSLGGTGTNSSNYNQTTHHFGSYSTSSGDSLACVMDDIRVTIGSPRYTGNFTPPTAPFPNS